MEFFESLNHPLRRTLAGEAHARPFMRFAAPAQVTHLAVFAAGAPGRYEEALAALCRHFAVPGPAPGAQHFSHDFGVFRLKWENHTEFCTFTFLGPGGGTGAFAESPTARIPQAWLASLAGAVLAAAHIVVEQGEPLAPDDARLQSSFPVPPLVGSRVLQGGEVWTDFHVGADGFSRFLVRDTGLRENQTGRLVQRICEIETYRMVALLALPLARRSGPQLAAIESALVALSRRVESELGRAAEETLLHELSGLAARVEALGLETGYRYSAAQAYYRLVKTRTQELREQRIEGVPTIDEFMDRRLSPAIDTCVAAAAHQERLANKIARVNDLLRTRVNIGQERQTQAVLESLSQSARLQVRLQRAVEGLSVVAISYYVVGLLAYLLKGVKGAGLGLEVDLAVGALLPIACGATWWGLHRLRRAVDPTPPATARVPAPNTP